MYRRFCINSLLPPLVAAAWIIAVMAISTMVEFFADGAGKPNNFRGLFGIGLLVVIYAYVFSLVPSLLFAFWMERRYTCGLSPFSNKALWMSSCCGGVAGLLSRGTMAWVFGGHTGPILQFLLFLPLGLVTGLIVGGVVKLTEKSLPDRSPGSAARSGTGPVLADHDRPTSRTRSRECKHGQRSTLTTNNTEQPF
jgi:hypothetical protein